MNSCERMSMPRGEVARAARALGVRLVHTSSLGATGPYPPERSANRGNVRSAPVNAYGESKRDAETFREIG